MWLNEWVYNVYKEKVTTFMRTAFLSSLIVGIIAHLYMFTNKLPNYDEIVCLTGGGISIGGGRWMLFGMRAIIYHFMGDYSLPWFYGLLSIIFISVSSALIVDILEIKNKFYCFLIASVIISFPALTSTLFFMFLSVYYCIGIFFGTLAVWITRKFHSGWILGSILFACSVGVYQAYLPYIIALLLLTTIKDTLQNNVKIREEIFILAKVSLLGSGLYIVLVKLFLIMYGQNLTNYQGIDKMGKIDISNIPNLTMKAYKSFIGLTSTDVIGLNPYPLERMIIAASFIITSLILFLWFKKKIKEKQWKISLWMLIIMAVFPLAANGIIILTNSETYVYSIMMYGTVCLFIMPILFVYHEWIKPRKYELWKRVFEWIFSLSFLIIIILQCQYSNLQYLAMDMQLKQAQSYYTILVTQIKSAEGYMADMSITFVGDKIDDKTYYTNDQVLGQRLSGRGNMLINANPIDFLKVYLGFAPEIIESDADLENNTKVKEMPCYPEQGSIKVIDGTVVVKIENIK